ncbi:hypothetical protein Cadr_000031146 [Camelus dromedarius]|uniref:Uncharacterized protein n=1 Tax=Camelus dromedarius TaxID=9838 RepID=A0A5N4BXC8_CAMDR|nr:hypothetical protein Cadr_000031146 [Camelus dromedarius]
MPLPHPSGIIMMVVQDFKRPSVLDSSPGELGIPASVDPCLLAPDLTLGGRGGGMSSARVGLKHTDGLSGERGFWEQELGWVRAGSPMSSWGSGSHLVPGMPHGSLLQTRWRWGPGLIPGVEVEGKNSQGLRFSLSLGEKIKKDEVRGLGVGATSRCSWGLGCGRGSRVEVGGEESGGWSGRVRVRVIVGVGTDGRRKAGAEVGVMDGGAGWGLRRSLTCPRCRSHLRTLTGMSLGWSPHLSQTPPTLRVPDLGLLLLKPPGGCKRACGIGKREGGGAVGRRLTVSAVGLDYMPLSFLISMCHHGGWAGDMDSGIERIELGCGCGLQPGS